MFALRTLVHYEQTVSAYPDTLRANSPCVTWYTTSKNSLRNLVHIEQTFAA